MRHLQALALAGLLTASCSDSPKTEEVASTPPAKLAAPLLGTWSVPVPELEQAVLPRDGKPDLDEPLRRALRASNGLQGVSVRITYRADRTGVIETTGPSISRKQPFSWSLLTATADRIRIDQETNDPPRLERITFSVDSLDALTVLDGTMAGSKLTRVK